MPGDGRRKKGKGNARTAARRRQPARRTTRRSAPRDARLAEALAQQAATSEILRLIGASPTDLQPVFDMMADRAMRLCGAVHAGVLTFDGELIHLVSHFAYHLGQLDYHRRLVTGDGRGTGAVQAAELPTARPVQ